MAGMCSRGARGRLGLYMERWAEYMAMARRLLRLSQPSARRGRTGARAIADLLLCAFLCAGLGACSMVKLRSDANTFYSSTVLAGRVSGAASWDHPIVVAAYTRRAGRLEIAHHTVLHEAGGYELIVPKGEYTILAFGDANGNLAPDAGEPVGEYAAPVLGSGSGAVVGLDFVIVAGARIAYPLGVPVAEPAPGAAHSTQVGAIADLNDPIFSSASGKNGYWAPVEFFRQAGGNIYFLEPYDPAKTPILFVHGAAGSPQDWKYFVEHIDRSRYQPWFFYYPSGAALDSSAYLLYWKMLNLQRRYHFNKIYLTAHSMGGLVVRSFLANWGAQFPAAKVFISLSTPWGGDDMSELGVQYSPAVIPSWNDMQPGGRFLQTLYKRPLPPGLAYYLFFGHNGHYSLMRSANADGTVTLSSQLRPAAQAEARMVYGYDEGHLGILSSPQVLAQYNTLLAAQEAADGKQAPNGNVRLSFAYPPKDGGVPPEPLLVLTPSEAGREKIILPISALDSGRELGPFPPGAYEANLLAYGFKTLPQKVALSIAPGTLPALAFSLTPQGVLSGYIGAELKPVDNPAGSYREPRRDVKIESITLSDGKQTRTLKPDSDAADRGIEHYVAGADYAYQAFFSFVGLAQGRYDLTIRAAGHEPYRKTVDVVPGEYGYFIPIDLKSLQK